MSNERPLLFVARDLSGFLPALPVLSCIARESCFTNGVSFASYTGGLIFLTYPLGSKFPSYENSILQIATVVNSCSDGAVLAQ